MITESVVTNYSERGKIRLELEVTMPYDESFPGVRQTIIDALLELPKVVKDPLPDVGIQILIVIACNCWFDHMTTGLLFLNLTKR
jgi:small-conductance mechanosensitive channel